MKAYSFRTNLGYIAMIFTRLRELIARFSSAPLGLAGHGFLNGVGPMTAFYGG